MFQKFTRETALFGLFVHLGSIHKRHASEFVRICYASLQHHHYIYLDMNCQFCFILALVWKLSYEIEFATFFLRKTKQSFCQVAVNKWAQREEEFAHLVAWIAWQKFLYLARLCDFRKVLNCVKCSQAYKLSSAQ